MAGIKGKDTKPELLIRRGLHALGFRYRLHEKKLPGKPDLVFPMHRAVIFVHGCFWHGHDCHLFKWPSTREKFWREKITANRENDAKHLTALRTDGWRVLVVWECALKGKLRLANESVIEDVASWLNQKKPTGEIRGKASREKLDANRTRRDKKPSETPTADEKARRSRPRLQAPRTKR